MSESPPSERTRRLGLDPESLIHALVDEDSWLPLTPGRASSPYRYGPEVCTGLATIDGRRVALYVIDSTHDKGFVTSAGADKIRRVMDRAEELGVPVIALLASAGVSVEEGLKSGEAYTRVITGNIRLSAVVPQIAVVLSVTMGAPAYSATLQDFVLFNKSRSHLMVTGPAVVASVLGETPTLAELGGAGVHAETTGIVDIVDRTLEDQLRRARELLRYLPSHRLMDPPRAAVVLPSTPLPQVPARPELAFDMLSFIEGLMDGSQFLELGALTGGAMLTGFAHLGGHVVGVVANQSLESGGAITALAARKAARFIRRCDAYNIPILNLIDVPGFMPGVAEESAGLLRHGANLCQAMTTSVPRLSVVVRKCYGAAAFVMLQTRSQDGDVVLALEGSRIAVMGFDAARQLVLRDAAPDTSEELLRQRYYDEYESPAVAYAAGMIDEVVTPDALRGRLIQHLDWLAQKRERPAVVRRHLLAP
jgi:acetyl-CoA carboxylase carboxyltransferase component